MFGGHLYGTPNPQPPPGKDIVLEIDIQGARQVRERHPDAVVVLVVAPTREEQERRLRHRGDPDRVIAERIAKADAEEQLGRGIADAVVVNDVLVRAVEEVAGIVDARRRSQRSGDG